MGAKQNSFKVPEVSWSLSLCSIVSCDLTFSRLSPHQQQGKLKVAYRPTGKGCTGSRKQNSLEMLTHNEGRHEMHPKPVYSSVCMQACLSLHLPECLKS